MVSWFTSQRHGACLEVSLRGACPTIQLSPNSLAEDRCCCIHRLLAMPQQRLLLLWDHHNWCFS